MKCLSQIIEFEKFYIFFGQLIAEWRIKYQSAAKEISFDFKKAKRDVVDLLDKLQTHPYYSMIVSQDNEVKAGLNMLDYLKKIFKELLFYLNIKQKCIKDYLFLWSHRDGRQNHFCDYLLMNKFK